MKNRLLYKVDKFVLAFIFVLTLFIPFITGLIAVDKKTSGIEKRVLNPLPSIPKSISDFSQYPKKFNLYYSDHFGLRETLTKEYFKLINKLN